MLQSETETFLSVRLPHLFVRPLGHPPVLEDILFVHDLLYQPAWARGH